jgi:hypothetical protein
MIERLVAFICGTLGSIAAVVATILESSELFLLFPPRGSGGSGRCCILRLHVNRGRS